MSWQTEFEPTAKFSSYNGSDTDEQISKWKHVRPLCLLHLIATKDSLAVICFGSSTYKVILGHKNTNNSHFCGLRPFLTSPTVARKPILQYTCSLCWSCNHPWKPQPLVPLCVHLHTSLCLFFPHNKCDITGRTPFATSNSDWLNFWIPVDSP